MNLQPIFWGGLIAGTLDILAAFLTAWWRRGISPVRVLQFISSGILGRDAFAGGPTTAVLGLALHFLIATTAAVVFYFASRRLLFLVERPVVAGLIYGVLVFLFMNFVVLPFSQVAQNPATVSGLIIGVLTIMFCVGLPIALTVRRFSR